eukprot:scaffold38521_cov43-Phaeocystis_antarctica.AAC.1
MPVGDAGASALAAALGRGALPRLKELYLNRAAIGDAGLILTLGGNPIGDEGLAALVAPPPPAGAPPPTGGLTKLKRLYQLYLGNTQVTDAGCATLAAAFSSGVLPALKVLDLEGIPASAAAMVSVRQAQARSDFCESRRVSLEG